MCGEYTNQAEREYSLNMFYAPICNRGCQNKARTLTEKSTPQAIRLYSALIRRGVPAELEKFDGHKHIDIAIPEVKINIEVDGQHHNYNAKQAFTDILRTTHSFNKGYYTIRIPNSILENIQDIEDTADAITHIANQADYNNRKSYY